MVEYCHIGNLRNYLLRNKDYFVDTMEDELEPGMEKKRLSDFASSKPHYVNKAQPESTAELDRPLTTKTLICYAYQVARGMEYLACKKVGIINVLFPYHQMKPFLFYRFLYNVFNLENLEKTHGRLKFLIFCILIIVLFEKQQQHHFLQIETFLNNRKGLSLNN